MVSRYDPLVDMSLNLFCSPRNTQLEVFLRSCVHIHGAAGHHVAFYQLAGHQGLDLALQQALHGPGAVDGVVAQGQHAVDGRVAEAEAELHVLQALFQSIEQQVDDLAQLFSGEGAKEHRVVDAV